MTPKIDFAAIVQTLKMRDAIEHRLGIFVTLMKEAEQAVLDKLDETGGDRTKFLEAAKSLGYHSETYQNGARWGKAFEIVEIAWRDDHILVTCGEEEYGMGTHVGTRREAIVIPARFLDGDDVAIGARDLATERALKVAAERTKMDIAEEKAAEEKAARQREMDRAHYERLRQQFENEKS